MDRLTARSPKNNMAYLVNVKPNEQDVESPYPNTLRCIMESFEKLAKYEDSGLSPEQVKDLQKPKTEDAMFCECRKEGECSTRDYGLNQYKSPCYHCCLGCKGAVEMTCTFVCSKVAEHYYPNMEGEG